jgi:Bacterial transcriptional activator domain
MGSVAPWWALVTGVLLGVGLLATALPRAPVRAPAGRLRSPGAGLVGLVGLVGRERRRSHDGAPSSWDGTGVSPALAGRGDTAAFLDAATRLLAADLTALGRDLPVVYAASLSDRGLTLRLAPAEIDPPAPWTSEDGGRRWHIDRTAGTRHGLPPGRKPPDGLRAPYPGLAAIGTDATGAHVLVDVEGAPGMISVGGDPATARDVAVSLALELATSRWSAAERVWMVGFPGDLTPVAPHRLRRAEWLCDVLTELEQRDNAGRGGRGGPTARPGAVLRGRQPPTSTHRPDVLVLATPPAMDDLERVAALADRRGQAISMVTVGDSAAARWRFIVGPDRRMSTGVLGLEVVARTLPVRHYAAITTRPRPLGRTPVGWLPPITVPRAAGATTADLRPWRPPDTTAPAPVEVRVLGVPTVDAGGPVSPEHVDLLTELVVLLALHPEGLYPGMLVSAIWPRGVSGETVDTTFAGVRAWLGIDENGHPRVVLGKDGRWRLGEGSRCDWDMFQAFAAGAGGIGPDTDDLAAALRLVSGPLWTDLPEGGYAWLTRTPVAHLIRRAVTTVAHRLAVRALAVGNASTALAASRTGLRAIPGAEQLWRDLLRTIASNGDRASLAATVGEMHRAIAPSGSGRTPSAETVALVKELLPGYRRRRPAQLLSGRS